MLVIVLHIFGGFRLRERFVQVGLAEIFRNQSLKVYFEFPGPISWQMSWYMFYNYHGISIFESEITGDTDL